MINIQLAYLSVALVSFLIGLSCGFFLRGVVIKTDIDENIDQSFFVLAIVTIIWAVSMIVDIINPSYSTSPMVHGLMGGIVGFYFYKPKK